MVDKKTLHRKIKIEENEPTKTEVNSFQDI